MRFRMVMLAMVASGLGGLACQKDPAPLNATSNEAAATSSALAPSATTPPLAPTQGALEKDRIVEKVEKHALSPATGAVVSGSQISGSQVSAAKADEGNGEPMDDVDDGVSATDKSGVDNAAEGDDSDGTDIKVEE